MSRQPTQPYHMKLACCRCGVMKRLKQLYFDRHGKYYCAECASIIDLCDRCGTTNIDDDSVYGQLHYDDWCFE